MVIAEMHRVNWNNTEKGANDLRRKVKNVIASSNYLSNKPEEGYFIDNISKKTVKISECKSSTLRRYIGLLDKYYYTVTSQNDKQFILNKKIEIETELNSRGDEEVK